MRGIHTGAIFVVAIGLVIGSMAGTTAQDEVGPVEFNGRFEPSSMLEEGTIEFTNGRIESRGQAWTPLIVEMSDPRLAGTMTYSSNVDRHTGPDGAAAELGVATYRIVNDEGAWEGSTPFFSTAAVDFSPATVVLVGEDAYEGLIAVMDADWNAISGVIVPGPPPPVPSAP